MNGTMNEKLLIQSFPTALVASIKLKALEQLLINDSNRAEYNQLIEIAAKNEYSKLLKSLGADSTPELASALEAMIARLIEQ